MRKIIIKGGRQLEGEVKISGAKNSALAILAGTILLPGKSVIRNVPNLLDVTTIIRVLRALGIRAEYSASQKNTVEIPVQKTLRGPASRATCAKDRISLVSTQSQEC